MDETYIHTSHTTPYAWSDNSLQGLFSPVSKGQRLIIIHGGGENGFVPNAHVRFRSQQKSGDYHSDMNFANYEKWLKERLIPNLPQNSVLVVDNAPYHVQMNRAPTSNSRRNVMISWLEMHLPEEQFKRINFSSLRNPDIYEIILPLKPKHISYKTDHLLSEHNHSILRLPSYHPELNPIELIWDSVKNWVAERNVSFKMDDVLKLTDEKFASITAQEWKECCRHVKDVETRLMEREGLLDVAQEMVFHVRGDSDGTSDSEATEEDDDDDGDGEGNSEALMNISA
ncbi:hypothetical protein ANN_27432 [Periplaneta americana]|uniref:Tc1-like transposase DDE domain-containing protein n=1 Tax=Periplaneta americana TaxID=6978 RepID=A0ABQ8RVT5_PERAM|nr:hypothetical protein ANN_27432 [Periplaneta americana]